MRPPKKYFIISGTYNADQYVAKCISSVKRQTLDGFEIKHILIDDGSTDNTYAVMQEWSTEPQIIVRHNKNLGSIQSQLTGFQVARQLGDDHDVIIQLDGDDWFNRDDAVATIHRTYVETDCGATYGDYVCTDGAPSGCRAPDWKNLHNDMKMRGWALSAPRTFRIGYTRHLTVEELKNEDGEFYPAAYDVAIYLPIAEMAGQDRVVWIREPLMMYNRENPIRDARIRYFDQVSSAHACYARPARSRVEL